MLRKTVIGSAAERIYRLFNPSMDVRFDRYLERIHGLATSVQAGRTVAPAGGSKRILINSHFAWNYSSVEYVLAAALRERGHTVTMVACGGLPDYCQRQNSTQERPPCDVCLSVAVRHFKAFDLPFVTMSDHLGAEDIEHARQIARDTPLDRLKEVVETGVNVGYLAYINLFQYFKGFSYEITPEVEAVFRRCVSTAILTARASKRLIQHQKPDVFVSINGKFLHWAPFVKHAERAGIPFVTWEDFQIAPTTVMFATNEIAHEQRNGQTWESALSVPLTAEQTARVRDHFKLWSTGAVTPWAGFGSDVSEDGEAVRKRLGLSPLRPVVSLFPNIAWDSSSVGFETAFESVFDWLSKTIIYAARRPDMDFVIRAHPAETRLPAEWRSTIPTCDALRKYGPPIPENVRLVAGDEPVNSYALASISSAVMTYTSTLGMELPLRGIRPWVAAGPYYGRKGLTVDLESVSHLYALLDANAFPPRLTSEEVERAERLAYLTRFRGTFEFPLLDAARQVNVKNWSELGPGGNEILEELCARVLNTRPMIDLRPSDSGIPISPPAVRRGRAFWRSLRAKRS